MINTIEQVWGSIFFLQFDFFYPLRSIHFHHFFAVRTQESISIKSFIIIHILISTMVNIGSVNRGQVLGSFANTTKTGSG